jgi:chromosome segregation ATPase
MSATLLEPASEMPEAIVPCANCPALQRVERELGVLRREVSELRCEVGYWRSRHTDAVQRNQQLAEELHQAKGEIRTLRDERFGRKSEKVTSTDRSNDLLEPLESSVPSSKRGAQPGQVGHVRRDYSHLPQVEEFISLPTESLACPI